jgi:hypothetical protein
LTIGFAFSVGLASAQVATVFDRRHLQIVNENAISRSVAEQEYQRSLNQVQQNTKDIANNLAALALAETVWFKSLSEVDQAMENSIQVKQILRLLSSVQAEGSEVLLIAKNDPSLLLFAEQYVRQAREKGVALVNQLSSFVLQEGDNILINYNVRDELLTEILKNLREIHGQLLAINQSMYWTKIHGKLKILNPYQNYVNQDAALVERILSGRTILKR